MSRKKLFVGLFCLSALASLLIWLWPHDARYYYNRGEERLLPTDEDGSGADFNGALADFNRAIKLNTNFAAAYKARGGLEEGDQALADFNRAIELDPTNKLNYLSRAHLWENHGNFNKAIIDLNQAIEIDPKDEGLFTQRAQLKRKLGNFVGMVTDMARAREVFPPGPVDQLHLKMMRGMGKFNNDTMLLKRLIRIYDHALEQDTNFYWGYFHRGVLKHLANDLDGALADFYQCQKFPEAKLRDYAAIHIWLVRKQHDEKTDADRDLSAYLDARMDKSSGGWEAQIAKFLLNQITEMEFSAVIGVSDAERERSQFWYYAAMKQLLANNKDKARDCFQKSRSTETRPYEVAISSQIELNTLAQ